MPAPTDPDIIQIVLDMYENGAKRKEIARATGLHERTIQSLVKKSNIPQRSSGRQPLFATISDENLDLLDGLILGDGFITRPQTANAGSRLQIAMTESHLDFLEWVSAELSRDDINTTISYRPPEWSGPGASPSYVLWTQNTSELKSIRYRWYTDERKAIPDDLVLTSTAIMAWHTGDGTLRRDGSVVLYTNSFTFDECDFLVSIFPVKASVISHKPGKNSWSSNPDTPVPLVYIPPVAARELFRIIGPPPVPSFSYKFIE